MNDRASKSSSQPGLIVMIDGPDGVGKTTQLKLLAETLQQQGYSVFSSRVNGGTEIGEALRTVYLDPKLQRPPETDLYIMLGMHSALASELLSRRQAGEICLIDRSPLSIIAYQVYGSGLDAELGEAATLNAIKLFDPDLIICYEAPLPVLQSHREQRHKSVNNNYFENQPPYFMARVIEGYKHAAEIYQGVKVINTSGTIPEAQTATLQRIEPLLPKRAATV
jgi:dTMP kinase